jgi:5-methylthioadenosine/S-adenosylhomocysteine deaminase
MRTLIRDACVISVNPARDVFDGGFVVIDGNRISAIGPRGAEPSGDWDQVIDARGALAVPGLINMHQHVYMNLLKGLADGMLLEPWVFNFSTPSRKFMGADQVLTAARLGVMEMLRTGTTCMLNHQSNFGWDNYLDDIAGVISGSGMRQLMAMVFQCKTPKMPDHPFTAEQATHYTAGIIDQLHGSREGLTRMGLVVECNAHHTELGRSSDELVRAGHALACARDLRIAVHMSGGTLSMKMGFTKYRRQTGRSDVAYLERLGVLDHRWVLKHGIHFSDEDMADVARRGAHVVYTPTSESIRGGGMGPWVSMLRAGINCTLGSDGPAVDYSVDMVEQMKACCYLQNVRYGQPAAIDPHTALEMATINAARALGWDDEIGSLEVGKRADVVLFERSRPHLQMVADPLRALVQATRGADARQVFVNGRLLYDAGRFTTIPDAQAVMARARDLGFAVADAAGFAPLTRLQWPGLAQGTGTN